jgi:Transposase zinc-binding domain/Putative transposase
VVAVSVFLSTHDSRFSHTYGPLKPYVEKTLGALQLCGDPNFGVTRFKCCGCGTEMGVPFSCKTRICPSCVKRKAEEAAANLIERLSQVDHRHIVITIPRKAGLRLRILQDPRLFRKIARIIVRVLRRQMVRQVSMNRARKNELQKVLKPGILMCQHSFASDLSFHPHWHLIVSDGVFAPDGNFYHLWNWNVEGILEDLRSSILKAFVGWSKLSPEVAAKLGSWESDRSGFSCFVTQQTIADDRQGLGRLIRYLFRSPCSYRQLSYDESTGKVRCRSKRGGHKEWHATEFLAVLSQHVPKPRQHLVTYAGHYANAAGNLKSKEPEAKPETETQTIRQAGPGFRRYSWA